MNEFRKSRLPRATAVVKDEKLVLADSHIILKRWKNLLFVKK